jgi:superfamily II DNA/RNA helicase
MKKDEKGSFVACSDTYMHRSGRSGRLGNKGVSLTLFYKDEEETCYNEIIVKLNL